MLGCELMLILSRPIKLLYTNSMRRYHSSVLERQKHSCHHGFVSNDTELADFDYSSV